jgi:hypothetical protein
MMFRRRIINTYCDYYYSRSYRDKSRTNYGNYQQAYQPVADWLPVQHGRQYSQNRFQSSVADRSIKN